MNTSSEEIQKRFQSLFTLADNISDAARQLLDKINRREMKLFDLKPHQRIFLFILTRSLKTYASIITLCKNGYGQDAATLLRSLLENLITAGYILKDKKTADEKAARFVAYKWIIFKRQLPEQEKNLPQMTAHQKQIFMERKKKILEQYEAFKKKFRLRSDQALLTWSGKTVKDMAREISKKLLEEYETTFRLCSRFSHPSILGDQEYMLQDGKNLIFSPLPSLIGVAANLKNSMSLMIQFTELINIHFKANEEQLIKNLYSEFASLPNIEKLEQDNPSSKPSQETTQIRESTIKFEF